MTASMSDTFCFEVSIFTLRESLVFSVLVFISFCEYTNEEINNKNNIAKKLFKN